MTSYQCGGHRCQARGEHENTGLFFGDGRTKDAQGNYVFDFDFLRGLTTASEEKKDEAQEAPRSLRKRQAPASKEKSGKKVGKAIEATPVCAGCPVHCCKQCSLHCPPPGTPTPSPTPPLPTPPVPTPPTPNPPVPGSTPVSVQLPSAYYNDRVVEAIDRGNGDYELIGKTDPINGKSLVIKVIDAQEVGFDVNKSYSMQQVARFPAHVINVSECMRFKDIVASLRDKTTRTPQEEQKFLRGLIYLNSVDVMFGAKQYIPWLYKFTGLSNINDDSVNFLACFVNLKGLDNAFFSGMFMVFGAGSDLFYPLGDLGVMFHELSHGFVQKKIGLIYQGHAGAMNEHIADTCSIFCERETYRQFNEDTDPGNDLRGKFDWQMGEMIGKRLRILRNFQNPEDAPSPQPSTFKGKYWVDPNSASDYGGVHSNSGPLNRFVYELVQQVGWDVAGAVLMFSWGLLTAKSNMIHYRDALKKAGMQNSCLAQVQACLNTVGLTDSAVNDWKGSA